MKSKNLTLIAAVGLLAISCQKGKFECEVDSNERPTELNVTEPFKGVVLSTFVNVYVSEATEHDVRIEGTSDGVNGVDIYVEDEILYIDRANNNCLRGEEVDVYVDAPFYELLMITGSGNIEVMTKLDNSYMLLKVTGSGNIDIPDLAAAQTDILVSGSGNIRLMQLSTSKLETTVSGSGCIALKGGTAPSNDLLISGSGEVHAFDFIIPHVNATVSGSGNADIYPTDQLIATITGSGNIRFMGQPHINSTITGTGNLIPQ